MSARTGRYYADIEDLRAKEPKSRLATEILHFKLYAPNESYGIARWIGNLISVMGSRLSEEVNFLYFENKGVPPLAIIFSGGRIASESAAKIESFIEHKIKGQSNFHSVLIIEAETDGEAGNSGRGQIKIQPLTEAQVRIPPRAGFSRDRVRFPAMAEFSGDRVGFSVTVVFILERGA